MKKKNLKLLKINKKTISKLSVEEIKGGTGGSLSNNPGVYCSAGPTTSYGKMACEIDCECGY
ncbi:hypothetical protein IMCC3317_29180 [Kordia antarctica]|uniref:Uncharacterized protein n=1 Tax=Kordia antarctica TaxID=1218801 RepID=A0A7L4ZM80_9FLAO|nr:hypothetical protein [Kordia antarctica]QHI37539.1 hypothetical protein IMCC3317_29180 [Kordia antarctica]